MRQNDRWASCFLASVCEFHQLICIAGLQLRTFARSSTADHHLEGREDARGPNLSRGNGQGQRLSIRRDGFVVCCFLSGIRTATSIVCLHLGGLSSKVAFVNLLVLKENQKDNSPFLLGLGAGVLQIRPAHIVWGYYEQNPRKDHGKAIVILCCLIPGQRSKPRNHVKACFSSCGLLICVLCSS